MKKTHTLGVKFLAVVLVSAVIMSVFAVSAEETVINVSLNTQSTSTDEGGLLTRTKVYLSVGETYELQFSYHVDSYQIYPLNYTGAFTITEGKKITGVSAGKDTVLVYYTTDEGQSRMEACVVEVVDLTSSTFLFKHHDSTWLHLTYDGSATNGLTVDMLCEENRREQEFQFYNHGNGYYSIVPRYSNAYLAVTSLTVGTPVKIISTLSPEYPTAYTQWKVTFDENNSAILIPEGGEALGLALSAASLSASAGGTLQLTQLSSDYDKKWDIYNAKMYLVNYYDTSVNNNSVYMQNINSANDFVKNYAFNYIHHVAIDYVSASYYWTKADACGSGQCDNSCNTDCSKHHKNIDRMMSDVKLIARGRNQVSVMWSDRDTTVYCQKVNNVHSSIIKYDANGQEKIPMAQTSYARDYNSCIQLFGVDHVTTNNNEQRILMSMVLAHETAHAFGLGEVTDLYTHTTDDCVMEYMSPANMMMLYQRIMDGELDCAFCDDCQEKLLTLQGKWYVKGNSN